VSSKVAIAIPGVSCPAAAERLSDRGGQHHRTRLLLGEREDLARARREPPPVAHAGKAALPGISVL